MSEDSIRRKLAAIVALDMVGFSRMMGEDEAGTLTRQKNHNKVLIVPAVTKHNGRIVKTTGDGLLIEFASAVDAVLCSVEIQRGIAEHEADMPEDRRISYRVGINLGEIVIDGDDIFGDGVNVAARLEALAEPGGIRIADVVFKNVKGKLDLGFQELGAANAKNIADPVISYHVLLNPEASGSIVRKRDHSRKSVFAAAAAVLLVAAAGLAWWQPWAGSIERASAQRMKFALPSKPSIAVLPFANLSNDKDQSFFANGITDDIVTDLSKITGIFVVASHSTRGYKDKDFKVRQIAEDLGVRHVLKGSVRREGKQLRVTAQLIDAIKGNHVWSDRYDREVKDVFAVQTEVTRNVVKAMAVTLKARENDRVFQKYVNNIEAYDYWQRARTIVEVPTRANIEKGEVLFKKAIELDPKFAGGYAGLSFNYAVKARFGFSSSREADVKLALELAKKAIESDPNFAWSHIALAGAYLANRKFDTAVDALQKALVIEPGGYEANLFMGFYLFRAGKSALAVKYSEIADNLSRVPTYRGLAFLGIAYFMDGNYAKSEETWKRVITSIGLVKHPALHVYLAASQFALNKADEAAATAARYSRIRPGFRMSKWPSLKSYKSEEFQQRLIRLAVKAGIPE